MNKEYHVDGFSIIMPTYNQSEFIRRAILSVIEQDLCIMGIDYCRRWMYRRYGRERKGLS